MTAAKPGSWATRGAWIGAMVSAVLCVSGCMPNGTLPITIKREQATDLHERMSQIVRRNGFSHGIRSVREDDRSYDSIYIAVSFDALKRRFVGLDKMLADVGRLCGDKQYAHINIRIELSGADDDVLYLRGLLEPGIAGANNVRIVSVDEGRNDIVITMSQTDVH